jgi:hypothetical protein
MCEERHQQGFALPVDSPHSSKQTNCSGQLLAFPVVVGVVLEKVQA